MWTIWIRISKHSFECYALKMCKTVAEVDYLLFKKPFRKCKKRKEISLSVSLGLFSLNYNKFIVFEWCNLNKKIYQHARNIHNLDCNYPVLYKYDRTVLSPFKKSFKKCEKINEISLSVSFGLVSLNFSKFIVFKWSNLNFKNISTCWKHS